MKFAPALYLCFSMAALAADPENGKLFAAPGGPIYYEVIGSGTGTPMIVVNGGPGFDHTYLHLSPVWKSLSRNRQIVFYDQRGNGRSAALKPGQSCTLADQIDDLEALRAHLGFERIVLFGHSYGGYLSMAYAARHTAHVERMIVVDSAAPRWSDTLVLFKDVFPETSERRDALAFTGELGDKSASRESIVLYLSMLFYSAEKRDAFVKNMPPNAFNKEVNEAVSRDMARFDLNPEIRKFKFPVLVVSGRYDINVAPSVAYKIHQAIPASRFTVFERSGHIPFYEEPEDFARVTEAFLTTPAL
jgi:proline iminopeptidase